MWVNTTKCKYCKVHIPSDLVIQHDYYCARMYTNGKKLITSYILSPVSRRVTDIILSEILLFTTLHDTFNNYYYFYGEEWEALLYNMVYTYKSEGDYVAKVRKIRTILEAGEMDYRALLSGIRLGGKTYLQQLLAS